MKKRLLCLLLLLPALVGCETLGPTLTRLAVAIGQDLIAAASVNHSPRYAVQLEQLLIALTSHTTGVQMQGQLAAAGYQPPPPDWAAQQAAYYNQTSPDYGTPSYSQGDYAQADYGQETYDQGSYAQDSYIQDEYVQDEYVQEQYQQDEYTQNEYSQGEYTQNEYSQDEYSQGEYTQDEYSSDQYSYEQYAYDSYDQQTYQEVVTRSARSIQLKTTLLARRAGTQELVEVNEGDTLFDGGADPASGDLLKVHFQANCACYVYIIGIDATGYVASIYPDPDADHANPVQAGESYLLPGEGEWWALDQQKGVEQVIFVASRSERPDLQSQLSALAGEPRAVGPDYRPVTELALPATRGLVKVKAEPLQLQNRTPSAPVHPSLFTTQNPGDDIVVTRWFYHQ